MTGVKPRILEHTYPIPFLHDLLEGGAVNCVQDLIHRLNSFHGCWTRIFDAFPGLECRGGRVPHRDWRGSDRFQDLK